MFLGRPTMDLLIETPDPKAAAAVLRAALKGYDVKVESLGRHGDLTRFRHMWRHL
jgi:hypothetical protein